MRRGFSLFVYGTLQPGYEPYELLCAPYGVRSETAIAPGSLYHLPLGYPAMVLDDGGWVHGHLLRFDHLGGLAGLDDYESHDEKPFYARYPGLEMALMEYTRSQIQIYDPQEKPLGTAWVYGMTQSQVVALEGILLPGGDWAKMK